MLVWSWFSDKMLLLSRERERERERDGGFTVRGVVCLFGVFLGGGIHI